ncbi:MAG TPA: peptidylprolyl isomerase [Puia sp.]|nr:peptidylprolyl isomerase [Puia sp.]
MRVALCRFVFACTIFSGCFIRRGQAQTLVRYGDQQISKADFLKAYNKNNSSGKPTEKSYREYLELYIRYKLKVRAAYEQRLDTLPTLVAELQNFRNQVADTYMHDDAFLAKLTNEAFERSQKDVHLAQIYIADPATVSPADTMRAFIKLTRLYSDLKKGKAFSDAADEYSDDPFAKVNHGDLGYITIFSLPYALETLAYQTAPGKFSAPYRSKSGYHIFKNLGERKAIGRIRAAQILLIFPHEASVSAKADTRLRADSIYQALLKGADFSELAKKFSGDNLSYQTGGEMPEFGVGQYDPGFENAAFSLAKDGEISHPVMTAFGYHIIKRLSRKPVTAEKSKTRMDALKQQVMNDSRIEASRKAMTQKIMTLCRFKENTFNENELWTYTDSSLQNKSLPAFAGLNASSILFWLSVKRYTVSDWIYYRNSIKNILALNRDRSNRAFLDQFEQTAAFDYYRSHLEDYNTAFAYQLNEFKDGNMLFEIMQRQVWDKASSDTLGLRAYYDSHQNNYWWESSANAILFTCANERAAEDVKSRIKNSINNWRRFADSADGKVQADSGRFELSQLPPPEQGKLRAGQSTSMLRNPADNSVTMAYIVKLYPDRLPRNYNDARGLVINDYQTFLEDQWIGKLKEKYPVKVNEAALKSLSR